MRLRAQVRRWLAASGLLPSKRRAPATWTEFCHVRLLGLIEQPRGLDKLEARRVVEACGFRCPRILRTFDSVAELDFDGLPDTFVLKPSSLAARRGVMVLQKALGGGRHRELFRRRYLTLNQIKDEQAEWQSLWSRREREPFKLIAEEWVVGENGPGQIPFDYKLYTIGHEVKFIAQYDRNVSPLAAAFFLNEFEPMEPSKYIVSTWKKISRGEPHVPDCWKDMIAAAKKISADLRTAFISVDAYATPDGPVIGELTVVPGGPYYGSMFGFTPEFDAELGRCWQEACRDLDLPLPEIAESTLASRKRPRLPHRLPSRAKSAPRAAQSPA